MSGTLTLAGMSAGLVSGEKIIGPVTDTGSSVVGAIDDATLSAGDNTFPVPSGAVRVAIFLGAGVAATVKLRTNLNAGDAGLQVAPYAGNGWQCFSLPSGSTSVILNASATVAGAELSFI